MRVESTSGKHAERRTDKRAPRWAINATNYRPALVAITRRTGIVRGALMPVWHGLTAQDVQTLAPLLADRFAVSTSRGIPAVVDAVVRALSA